MWGWANIHFSSMLRSGSTKRCSLLLSSSCISSRLALRVLRRCIMPCVVQAMARASTAWCRLSSRFVQSLILSTSISLPECNCFTIAVSPAFLKRSKFNSCSSSSYPHWWRTKSVTLPLVVYTFLHTCWSISTDFFAIYWLWRNWRSMKFSHRSLSSSVSLPCAFLLI